MAPGISGPFYLNLRMKAAFSALFLLTKMLVLAQITEGQVSGRGQAIPFASVQDVGSGRGVITDEAGFFTLETTGTIKISALGFRPETAHLMPGQLNRVELQPHIYDIAEVPVVGKAITVADILNSAKQAAKYFYPQETHGTGTLREAITNNGKYVRVAEANVSFHWAENEQYRYDSLFVSRNRNVAKVGIGDMRVYYPMVDAKKRLDRLKPKYFSEYNIARIDTMEGRRCYVVESIANEQNFIRFWIASDDFAILKMSSAIGATPKIFEEIRGNVATVTTGWYEKTALGYELKRLYSTTISDYVEGQEVMKDGQKVSTIFNVVSTVVGSIKVKEQGQEFSKIYDLPGAKPGSWEKMAQKRLTPLDKAILHDLVVE